MQGFESNYRQVSDRESSAEQLRQRIVYCVGTPEQLKGDFQEMLQKLAPEPVDYYADPSKLDNLGQKHVDGMAYVISAVNEAAKYSDAYLNCTGVVAVGKSKRTGKNISFLSHQNPSSVTEKNLREFVIDLTTQLRELSNESVEESMDVAIFGGLAIGAWGKNSYDDYVKEYEESIRLLGDIIQDAIKVDPTVLLGPNIPNMDSGESDVIGVDELHVGVIFDTEHRRLFIIRPSQEEFSEKYLHTFEKGPVTNITFPASELDVVQRRWRSDLE